MAKFDSFLFSLYSFTIIIAAYLLLLSDSSFGTTSNGYYYRIRPWRAGRVNHTKLEGAIQAKDEEGVKKLLGQGLEIKLTNNESETTLLHDAAAFQDKDLAIQVIKLLIDNGANVSATDDRDNTFLHKLMDSLHGLTPAQFQDVAAFLLSRDLSYLFNKPGSMHGITPFHLAVKYIEIENGTLALLRNNSVNFNAVDNGGESILQYAVGGSRSTRLISALITLGADPRHLNNNKESLLHVAAMGWNVETIKLFVNLGLDINKREGLYGMTPLHLAIGQSPNRLGKVRYLIEQGAKVNTKDGRGNTPLGDVLANYFQDDREELLELLRNNQ